MSRHVLHVPSGMPLPGEGQPAGMPAVYRHYIHIPNTYGNMHTRSGRVDTHAHTQQSIQVFLLLSTFLMTGLWTTHLCQLQLTNTIHGPVRGKVMESNQASIYPCIVEVCDKATNYISIFT